MRGRDTRTHSLSSHTEERPGKDAAAWKPGRRVSSETNQDGTLPLGFQPLGLWENEFLLFKPPCLWCSVTAAEQINTGMKQLWETDICPFLWWKECLRFRSLPYRWTPSWTRLAAADNRYWSMLPSLSPHSAWHPEAKLKRLSPFLAKPYPDPWY